MNTETHTGSILCITVTLSSALFWKFCNSGLMMACAGRNTLSRLSKNNMVYVWRIVLDVNAKPDRTVTHDTWCSIVETIQRDEDICRGCITKCISGCCTTATQNSSEALFHIYAVGTQTVLLYVSANLQYISAYQCVTKGGVKFQLLTDDNRSSYRSPPNRYRPKKQKLTCATYRVTHGSSSYFWTIAVSWYKAIRFFSPGCTTDIHVTDDKTTIFWTSVR